MDVLNTLGLQSCLSTPTEHLSGGQKKRLSIALEMVNNPPVIFLDEPTTGLDNVAVTQCVELLKKLSKQGKTVICTIHTPADSIFQLFDQVYFMSDGYCIYNGSVPQLVPFLSTFGFSCPSTYNPADYILEIVHMDKEHMSILSSGIDNGKIANFTGKEDSLRTTTNENCIDYIQKEVSHNEILEFNYPTSFWTQFYILISRMFLQMKRNKSVMSFQIVHHVLSGFLLGAVFLGVGRDAALVISNFNFCLATLVFFMYTYAMAPILIFPQEIKLIEREYFNRWYGLKPYYLALTLSTLPALIILGTIVVVIAYIMSSQPLDLNKCVMFCILALLLAASSEGLGIAIGTVFNVTNGSCVGPALLASFLCLCVHGVGYGTNIQPFMQVLMYGSYLRYCVVGWMNVLYENRGTLECFDEYFCPYTDSGVLLRDLGMKGQSYLIQVLGLVVYTILFRLIGYTALKYRFGAEFSSNILHYAIKAFKH